MIAHNLGFPRIGARRQLKFALEKYWRGEIDRHELESTGRELRQAHWKLQQAAGLGLVPVGDFSYYDQVLDHSAMFGVVPERFGWDGGEVDLDLYFRMARGGAPGGEAVAACEMTKWFDTNYHYLVPELQAGQQFRLSSERLFQELEEAKALGIPFKPVLVGPITWLWLSKVRGETVDRLEFLDGLLEVYGQILERLARQGAEWVQIDEPLLVQELPPAWRQAYESAYHRLQASPVKLLLTTYFGALEENLSLAARLPTAGLHLDLVRGVGQLQAVLDLLPPYKHLSLGLVDGRNVWRTDLDAALVQLRVAAHRIGGERLLVAPSCSLLHVPVDLDSETGLDEELRSWLAFATQKLRELQVLEIALDRGLQRRSSYAERRPLQRARLELPLFPTTTIGAGAWRAGKKRHGGILCRTARRVRFHPLRLGAVLWFPLRQAAHSLRRRVASPAHDGGLDKLRPVAHGKAHERHAHGAGDHSELVFRAGRPAACRNLCPDRPCPA